MERHSFCIVSGELSELCGNYTFLQKFQTSKLSEITVFYAVYSTSILRLTRPFFSSTYNYFNNKGIKHITRLRLGLSHLCDHKFKHGFFTLLIQSAVANWILKQLVIICCIAPILQIKD